MEQNNLFDRDFGNNQIKHVAADAFAGVKNVHDLWVYSSLYFAICKNHVSCCQSMVT